MDLLPSSSSTLCELKYWVFRLCKGPFIVRVQGYREVPGEYKKLECWLTSPISYCEGMRTVVTVRGSRYVLKGSMDVDQAIIFNYPEIVIDAFKNGFPSNWQRVLKHLHRIMNLAESMNTSLLSDAVLVDDDECEKVSPKATVRKTKTATVKEEANKNSCRIICATTPPSALSVSRSGRVIKPRLRVWEGERISYDAHGNPIAAHSSTTKTPGRPEFSTKLAAICDGMGVNNLESSKQTHRRSTVFEPPQKSKIKKEKVSKNLKKVSATRPLVEYPISEEDDDADSFMANIDRISLTPPPISPPHSDERSDELTPIPLKNYRARRVIHSNVRPVERNRVFKKEKTGTSTASNKKIPARNATNHLAIIKKTKEHKPDSVVESVPSRKTPPKKKRWTVEDTKRLKIALKAAINPQSDQDWEIIARSVSGGERSGDECRKQATKIRWKPPAALGESQPCGSYDATSSADTENSAHYCNFMKKKSVGGGNVDFFTQNKYEVSLLDLDPDDSLLSMLKTPTEEAKFTRKPFLMQQVLDETRRSARTNASSFDDTL